MSPLPPFEASPQSQSAAAERPNKHGKITGKKGRFSISSEQGLVAGVLTTVKQYIVDSLTQYRPLYLALLFVAAVYVILRRQY